MGSQDGMHTYLGIMIYFACMQDQHPNPSKMTKPVRSIVANMDLNANGATIHTFLNYKVYLCY